MRAVRVQLLAARLVISATRGAAVCVRGLRREPRADSATKSVTAMTTDDLPWKLWGAVTGYGETKSVTAMTTCRLALETLGSRYRYTKSVTAMTTDDLPWKLLAEPLRLRSALFSFLHRGLTRVVYEKLGRVRGCSCRGEGGTL